MNKNYLRPLLTLLFLLHSAAALMAQTTTITGTVNDAGGGPLPGVNIVVKGRVIGTITDSKGEYNLKVGEAPPVTLVFSFIGYKTQEIEIKDATATQNVSMEETSTLGTEIVVSASLMEESILQAPVSIEKMDIQGVQQTPSDNYYRGLSTLKGVDMTTSSINFQIINARGFNSTGNTRFVQLTDGMDTQAPALNFPIGNLNGPSELDVESVEFIPGAASALYGPNAFNGILLVNSKSPFEYQGLSAFAKMGVNHIGGGGNSTLDNSVPGGIGPGGTKPMYEGALRYAKAFNNKFAFKVAFSYSAATDWYGTNYRDQNADQTPTGFTFNPNQNQVHVFGDEVATPLAVVGLSPAFQAQMNGAGLGAYIPYLPNQNVSRTGYNEASLVDYNAKNMKANVALHYRITDKIEISGQWNYGAGTSVYTGAQRYSLKNFDINQAKLELRGDNFFLKGYTTIENSGDSYIADLTGVLINSAWKDNSTWFGTYAGTYLGALASQGFTPSGSNSPTVDQQMNAHLAARSAADVGRYLEGTPQFENAKATALKSVIPTGSLFSDKTRMYHGEGQYNFKNQIKFMDLIAGASLRYYELKSNGTIFADGPGNAITIQEVGAYVQGSKRVMDDKLKLTASIRYDKNQNFNDQFNPRISGVYTVAPNHFIRAAFQTGFRNPTTQGQHIDLNVVSGRLLGGLPYYAEKYNVTQYAYSLASVNDYVTRVGKNISDPAYLATIGGAANNGLALGDPATLALLVPVTKINPVKPENVQNFEVGYKGLIGDHLMVDLAYYSNNFTNFISTITVRKAAGPIDQNPQPPGTITEQNVRNAQTLLSPITTPGQENTFSVYTNIDKPVSSQGAAIGLEYMLSRGYRISGNYNWNKLNTVLGPEFITDGFNTPEHKFNLGFSNRKVTDKMGFNINYRYQNEFYWAATFARGTVPAVGVFDAQVSYKLSSMKSMLKIGGSNILNTQYTLNYGGPTMGAIYYVSITFDQLMK